MSVIRRAIAAILSWRTGRIWLEADCGCMYTVNPVQVAVCHGHRFEQEQIAQGMEEIFGVNA